MLNSEPRLSCLGDEEKSLVTCEPVISKTADETASLDTRYDACVSRICKWVTSVQIL